MLSRQGSRGQEDAGAGTLSRLLLRYFALLFGAFFWLRSFRLSGCCATDPTPLATFPFLSLCLVMARLALLPSAVLLAPYLPLWWGGLVAIYIYEVYIYGDIWRYIYVYTSYMYVFVTCGST